MKNLIKISIAVELFLFLQACNDDDPPEPFVDYDVYVAGFQYSSINRVAKFCWNDLLFDLTG